MFAERNTTCNYIIVDIIGLQLPYNANIVSIHHFVFNHCTSISVSLH